MSTPKCKLSLSPVQCRALLQAIDRLDERTDAFGSVHDVKLTIEEWLCDVDVAGADTADKPMRKFNNKQAAEAQAREWNTYFAMSVFGGWYVGTEQQLRTIGVPNPQRTNAKEQ